MVAYGVLASTASGYSLADLLSSGTSLLTWFLTSLGSILDFMLDNPALLIWFFASLVGLAFVYFRKLI